MTAPWLSIVGIGEDGLAGLAPAVRTVIETAELLAGGARHLAMIPETGAERLAWGGNLNGGLDGGLAAIAARRGRRVCVLASGDPMWFGIGATLARRFAPEDYVVLPHPGAFSLAAARLGWPLQEVTTLSVHARPAEAIALHLHPGARLLLLTEDGGTSALIAGLLRAHGYGPSRLTVFERLGGPAERRIEATAAAWDIACHALNTLAVECRPGPEARPLSRLAGLPDDAFRHDGQITKREIRAVTLAALAPLPGETLWDVGAGCGSIAIEWMRAGGRAVAVERDAAHAALIAANAARLGVPRLAIVRGEAPQALGGLTPPPDAVFLGGGVSAPGMLAACWRALNPGGRLVANAVTAEGEAALLAWQAAQGGEMTRLSVARLGPIGGFAAKSGDGAERAGDFQGWRPLMPVTQYRGVRT